MKNKIISIGWIGIKRCYLNISMNEALKRFAENENISVEEAKELIENNDILDIIEFDDEFGAYSIYEN